MNLNTLRLYIRNLTAKVNIHKLKHSGDLLTRKWLQRNLTLVGREESDNFLEDEYYERFHYGLRTLTKESENEDELRYGTGLLVNNDRFEPQKSADWVGKDNYDYKGETFERTQTAFTYSDDGIFDGMSHSEPATVLTLTYFDNADYLTGYASDGEEPWRHVCAATPEGVWPILELIEGTEGPYPKTDPTFRYAKPLTPPYDPDGGIICPDPAKLGLVDELNPIPVTEKPSRIPRLPYDRKYWNA